MARRRPKTRLELKRQREALARYQRFLGALKRKQQKLQMAVAEAAAERAALADRAAGTRSDLARYEAVLRDEAGLDVRAAAEPREVKTTDANIAGVTVPVFAGVEFPDVVYSLFATPAWVDRALAALRALAAEEAELGVLERRHALLNRELVRIVQRVNLFEKIMIPEAEATVRRIRIHLGDEMTAAVGRAKLAKAKLGPTAGADAGEGAS